MTEAGQARPGSIGGWPGYSASRSEMEAALEERSGQGSEETPGSPAGNEEADPSTNGGRLRRATAFMRSRRFWLRLAAGLVLVAVGIVIGLGIARWTDFDRDGRDDDSRQPVLEREASAGDGYEEDAQKGSLRRSGPFGPDIYPGGAGIYISYEVIQALIDLVMAVMMDHRMGGPFPDMPFEPGRPFEKDGDFESWPGKGEEKQKEKENREGDQSFPDRPHLDMDEWFGDDLDDWFGDGEFFEDFLFGPGLRGICDLDGFDLGTGEDGGGLPDLSGILEAICENLPDSGDFLPDDDSREDRDRSYSSGFRCRFDMSKLWDMLEEGDGLDEDGFNRMMEEFMDEACEEVGDDDPRSSAL